MLIRKVVRENQRMRIGVVGFGAIADDLVRAIEDVNPGKYEFYLSPRNAKRGSAIIAEHSNFHQLASNQEVVDQSDLVFIGVLPTQVDEVLSELNFRADQIVASLAAGKAPSHVAKLVAPATKVAQLIPLPMIEYKKGPIVCCPKIPEISQLLQGLGDVIEFDDETIIPIFSTTSAIMSTYFTLVNHIIDWKHKQGVNFELSAKYVTSLLEALGTKANHIDPKTLKDQPVKHETPGGLNESNRVNLENTNWYEKLTDQLDYLMNVFIPGLKNKK